MRDDSRLNAANNQPLISSLVLRMNRSDVRLVFLFKRLQGMAAIGRLPRLSKEDPLHGPPLFLVPDDLNAQIEEL